MTRIISQSDLSRPGKPGIQSFRAGPTSGKASDIRILKANNPKSGVNQEESWSTTEDIVGDPTPQILSANTNKIRPTTDSRIRVKDRRTDRDVTVR